MIIHTSSLNNVNRVMVLNWCQICNEEFLVLNWMFIYCFYKICIFLNVLEILKCENFTIYFLKK
jgi:hypothetical protein